jgi:glycosyltransferase involved in cell wall biosynthesis
MQILWLSGREITYPRNDVLLRALQRFSTVQIVNPVINKPKSLFWRSISIVVQSVPYLSKKHYDLIFIGFYGHFIMILMRLLTKSPIIFDAFISTYDTLCFDRKLFKPGSMIGRLAYWLDKKSCQKANMVLLDTPGQVRYFNQVFQIPAYKIKHVCVGCNEDIFYPRPDKKSNHTTVLFYSTYQPLHGVDMIIRAANMLKTESKISFRIIGDGQTFKQVNKLAEGFGLHNIKLLPIIPFEQLAKEISNADICLGGHFGSSSKAARVIPGKIYQILAMGKPLIASNTHANKKLLTHLENAYLCEVNDPRGLATGIRKLHHDRKLRETLAENGHKVFLSECSESVISEQVHGFILDMVKK